ncbi:MAG: type II toxin-antitoxin system death-on-curing family toxin [Microscillaceae bacterium]|nr:type II toxin-antitoxin system death-on-curing family toxin [Microscillaceae bacterium]
MHQKAALYLYNIISNHIFQDGNKRTGLQSAIIFLLMNGYDLQSDDETLIHFTLSVASAELSLEPVQAWFEEHIVG